MDQWAGRADEPNHQGSHRGALSLRPPGPAQTTPRRLRRRLQLRPPAEDAQGPHTLRVHLQEMDKRASKVQARSNPPNAGTEQLGDRLRRRPKHHAAAPYALLNLRILRKENASGRQRSPAWVWPVQGRCVMRKGMFADGGLRARMASRRTDVRFAQILLENSSADT